MYFRIAWNVFVSFVLKTSGNRSQWCVAACNVHTYSINECECCVHILYICHLSISSINATIDFSLPTRTRRCQNRVYFPRTNRAYAFVFATFIGKWHMPSAQTIVKSICYSKSFIAWYTPFIRVPHSLQSQSKAGGSKSNNSKEKKEKKNSRKFDVKWR